MPLDDFRIDDATEITAWLNRLAREGTLVQVARDGAAPYMTVLLAVDAKAGRIGLDAQPRHPAVVALAEAGEATAVAYLDSIKLQFDLGALVLVHRGDEAALHARLPRAMYRFQRRSSFRVRVAGGAHACFANPADRKTLLTARVIDLSIGGCALALPPEAPDFDAGAVLERVRLELDADTRIDTALTVQHAVRGAGGLRRIGCAFASLDGGAQRTLQRCIDLTQRRARALVG